MEVRVHPSERRLEHQVEIPQIETGRHDQTPPDLRLDAIDRDTQLHRIRHLEAAYHTFTLHHHGVTEPDYSRQRHADGVCISRNLITRSHCSSKCSGPFHLSNRSALGRSSASCAPITAG